jgi:hypothetical protein
MRLRRTRNSAYSGNCEIHALLRGLSLGTQEVGSAAPEVSIEGLLR